MDATESPVTVRPATPADAKAIRMLLPQATNDVIPFVAVECQEQRVVGAVAVSRALRPKPPMGPGIALRVIKPYRRRGIGNSLLSEVLRLPRSGHVEALYATQKTEAPSAEMTAWEWMGFVPFETVKKHELPLDQFEPRLAPLLDRLRSGGRIPADAQIVPLYRADHAAVLRLHLDQLGGDRDELYRRIRGDGADAYHPRYSRVLVVGDRVMGCILAHRAGQETAVVDANILDPSVRGGWANIWLKLEATRGAISLGIKNFEYSTFDHYTDTRSFTAKLGGTTVRTRVLMYRLIN